MRPPWVSRVLASVHLDDRGEVIRDDWFPAYRGVCVHCGDELVIQLSRVLCSGHSRPAVTPVPPPVLDVWHGCNARGTSTLYYLPTPEHPEVVGRG